VANSVVRNQAEAFVASDYQGETIQVFVFHRERFLGYQCFGQDRLTIGGAPGMDLPLPDCPEAEGYWDVYICRGALYAWLRSPAGGNGNEGHEDPRKVQPLDSFLLGEYRFQAKLLNAEGFFDASNPAEATGAQEELPPIREMRAEEERERVLSGEPVSADGLGQAVISAPPEEVQGIRLDYARSIWKEERADRVRSEDPSLGDGAQTFPHEARERGPAEQPLIEAAGPEPLPEIDPDDTGGFWGLCEEAGNLRADSETGEPDAQEEFDRPDAGEAAADRIDEWIGFGLEEAAPVGEESRRSVPIRGPGGSGERIPLETGPDATRSMEPAAAAEPAKGPEAGGRPDARTLFLGEPAGEAVLRDKEVPAQVPGKDASGNGLAADTAREPFPAQAEISVREETPAGAPPPTLTRECLEEANAALSIDEPGPEEACEHAEEGDRDEIEEDEQDAAYFSLVRELFPSRDRPSKAPRGDHRALEVMRFRGSDVQEVGYLERGGAFTIRKGWPRGLWKRQGGVPPDFELVRIRNGGLAELHLREGVKGRLYSEDGSRDLADLGRGRRGRFGFKEKSFWLPMPADTWAVLRVNSARYLVRYVLPRPKPVVQPLRPRVSAGQFKLVSLSVLSHLLLIVVVGLAVPDRTLEGYSRVDQFARIDPDALKTLKPTPPPKEVVKPELKPEPKPVKKEVPTPKPKATTKHTLPTTPPKAPAPSQPSASGGGGTGKKQVDVAQTGLLAALGSPDAGLLNAKGNSEILLAAVTNLDAVAVPSDTTTFNLAGVAGKLATSEIQVPTSDVIETVGAAQLIKNGDGTLGAMASKGSGEVRAVVHEPPKANISIRGGMSREAVLKVVNTHLGEIQDCYERELLHNPGISGKILMEWLIELDGTVRYAKVKFTNIGHSSDLHSCLQAQVVTWNFPRPKGGEEVLVTFPFLFESMGF
jgi:hypothetical protein